jgi:O-antigen ligase
MSQPITPAECEVRDPTGHALHVCAAIAWGFFQSIANSPEGIAWGVLLTVTMIRVPRIASVYRVAFRDPAFWCLLGWAIWMKTTLLWSPEEVDRLAGLKPVRWLITPLLLWPVMGRPWVVLVAIAAGGTVQAIAAIIHSFGGEGFVRGSDMRGLTSFGQLTGIATLSTLIVVGGVLGRPWRMFIPAAAVAAVCGFVLIVSASRTMMLGAVGGGILILWRLGRRPGARLVAQIGTLLTLILACLLWQGTPAISKWMKEFDDKPSHYTEDPRLSLGSHRTLIWQAAWEIGIASPLRGCGKNSFQAEFNRWVEANLDQERLARSPQHRDAIRQINHAHNAVMQAWAEGGIPAVALVVSGLTLLVVRAWRMSRLDRVSMVAASLSALVVASALFGIFDSKASGAVIAVVMVFSWRGDLAARGGIFEIPPRCG